MSADENENKEEPDRMTAEDWERFDRLSAADNLSADTWSSIIHCPDDSDHDDAVSMVTNATSEPSHNVREDAATAKASQPNTYWPEIWTNMAKKQQQLTGGLIGVKSNAKVTIVARDRNVAPRSERVPNTPHGGNAQSASSSGEQARTAQNSIPRSQQIGIVCAYRPRCAHPRVETERSHQYRSREFHGNNIPQLPTTVRENGRRGLPYFADRRAQQVGAKGMVILMPVVPMPFPNNSTASTHSCTHYDLIVAVGIFTLPQITNFIMRSLAAPSVCSWLELPMASSSCAESTAMCCR
jgi:hypothetical protein